MTDARSSSQLIPIEAFLFVSGVSPSVLRLANEIIGGEVEQRHPIQSGSLNTEAPKLNFIIIEIPLDSSDGVSEFKEVETWLTRNRTALMKCDADKLLEFRTYLCSNTGARMLTFPNSLIQIAADLKLNVANQAIRIITEEDRNISRNS